MWKPLARAMSWEDLYKSVSEGLNSVETPHHRSSDRGYTPSVSEGLNSVETSVDIDVTTIV